MKEVKSEIFKDGDILDPGGEELRGWSSFPGRELHEQRPKEKAAQVCSEAAQNSSWVCRCICSQGKGPTSISFGEHGDFNY